MTSIATIIRHRRPSVFLSLLLLTLLMPGSRAMAQHPMEENGGASILDTIPEEAKAVFFKYVQQKDTVMETYINKHRRDKFIKRFSFHTNVVDWATLVPNIGVEFDLKGTPRNNYSISVFGKFNGKSKHGKLVYNVNAFRVEGRKYWRTGKHGKAKEYYDDFVKLHTDTASIYFNADSLAGVSYYVDTLGTLAKAKGVTGIESIRATPDMSQAQRDSLDIAEDSLGIKKSKFRKWYYNTYHKVRRNVTSGRTLENARNWRAYYLGVWAGIDNWSISLTGKGKQGRGMGAGVLTGYTLPLLPQSYPREGSLDLDFGLAVGWKAVDYDAYVYEEQTQHYVYDRARSSNSWKIVPYPIIQDVHVSLVWRFRGIKGKVDKSLIDDYEKKWVGKYDSRSTDAYNKYIKVQHQRKLIMDRLYERYSFMADSTGTWDAFNRRRLDAAMRINPDTVFTGKDQEDYLKIFKGLKSQSERDKYLKDQEEATARQTKAKAEQDKKEAKAAAERIRKAAKEMRDSLADARKDSIRNAKKRGLQADTTSVVSSDTITKTMDVEQSQDTTMVLPQDTVPAIESQSDNPVDGDGFDIGKGWVWAGRTRKEKKQDNAETITAVALRKWENIVTNGCIYWNDEL